MGQDNLTIDELLKIAESEDQPSHRRKEPTDVNKYIKHFNIKAGTTKVPTLIIYHHYRQWRKSDYMSKSHFFQNFKHIFESTKFSNEMAYYLDPEPYDLSLEARLKARSFLRKEKDGKRQKSKS